MIDLHTHTNESDGTYSPAELVAAAVDVRLDALAITDHDTFAGFDQAAPLARQAGLTLVCGIEISTALGNPKTRTAHLLGYFPGAGASQEFRAWIAGMQAARRDRNTRLVERLRFLGLDVEMAEVEKLGRNMAGRPHFARVLIAKGYCSSIQDAFDRYLSEDAPGYVDREEPALECAIGMVQRNGGVASLAHPVRLGKRDAAEEERLIAGMRDAGLLAIEVFHSDHSAADTARYLGLAKKYGFRMTGGSDFHGANKPHIALGTGPGRLSVSNDLLERLF